MKYEIEDFPTLAAGRKNGLVSGLKSATGSDSSAPLPSASGVLLTPTCSLVSAQDSGGPAAVLAPGLSLHTAAVWFPHILSDVALTRRDPGAPLGSSPLCRGLGTPSGQGALGGRSLGWPHRSSALTDHCPLFSVLHSTSGEMAVSRAGVLSVSGGRVNLVPFAPS